MNLAPFRRLPDRLVPGPAMNALTDASASFHTTPRVHRARPVTRSVEDETHSASLRTTAMACYIVAIGGLLLSAGLLSMAAVIGAYLLRADARSAFCIGPLHRRELPCWIFIHLPPTSE